MGTWSHEPFGNDTASDWAYEFEEQDGHVVIEQAFDEMIDMATEDLSMQILVVLHMLRQMF
jgi:hypothetical protein